MDERLSDDLLIDELGFKPIPHFTIANSLILDLGRDRHLSIGSVGTPNEMLFICSTDPNNSKKVTDIICLHNYDYDGYMTSETLSKIIQTLSKK